MSGSGVPRLRIRRALAKDCSALTRLALDSKAVHGYDKAFIEMCREELAVAPQTIAAGETWLACRAHAALAPSNVGCPPDHGGPVGFYDLRLDGDVGDIYALFVSPEVIGKGVGRALWHHLEGRARALGLAGLTVESDPFALGFYQACGLETIGSVPSGSIPGRWLPRLAKRL